jgi:hypothetical protein
VSAAGPVHSHCGANHNKNLHDAAFTCAMCSHQCHQLLSVSCHSVSSELAALQSRLSQAERLACLEVELAAREAQTRLKVRTGKIITIGSWHLMLSINRRHLHHTFRCE